VVKQVTPNTVDLRYRDGHRLEQSVHVNRLKLYKERVPIEELDIKNSFNPTSEKVNDNTDVGENSKQAPEEVDVRDIHHTE
jgi:hypothetical protein